MKKMVENNPAELSLPKVSIIIVNHNKREFLLRTLAELFRLNYSNFEIVLVDNASMDGSSEEVKRSFSKTILIKNSKNIGIYAGMNIGIKYALERGAKYILLLSHDAGGIRQALPVLVDEMEKNSEIGLSSPVISKTGVKKLLLGGKVNWLKMALVPYNNLKKIDYSSPDYLVGGAMLVRAEIFRKTGLLNENYLPGYGEIDLSFKAHTQGYKLLNCQTLQVACLERSQNIIEKERYLSVFSSLVFFKNNTPVYLIPWAFIFFGISFLKNQIVLKISKKDFVKNIQQAYLDFYHSEGIF